MIHLDMALIISFLLSAAVMGLFLCWLMRIGKPLQKAAAAEGQTIQCPYCGNVMSDCRSNGIVTCSLCNSYLEAGHDHRGKKD